MTSTYRKLVKAQEKQYEADMTERARVADEKHAAFRAANPLPVVQLPLKHPHAGERQTLARCHHPELGEGLAIYDNGAASFVPDATGETIAFKSIRLGGASSGIGADRRRSWLRGIAGDGTSLELETTDRPSSDRHTRAVSLLLGDGWMVDLSGFNARFEADSGAVVQLSGVRQMFCGKGRSLTERERKKLAAGDLAEHEKWLTYQGDFGAFVWRRA